MSKEWEWFMFSPMIKPHFIPDGHGAYELVIEARCYFTVPCAAAFGRVTEMYTQSTPTYRICVHNTKIGDADCYSTSDLVIPHPTFPGYWKIFGRADDQLMHNTGEKVRTRRRHLDRLTSDNGEFFPHHLIIDEPSPVR